MSGKSETEKGQPLKHSEEYLKAKTERYKLIAERKRAASDNDGDNENEPPYKRLKPGTFVESRDADGRIAPNYAAATEKAKKEQEQIAALRTRGIKMLGEGMVDSTVNEYLTKYGDKALHYWDQDQERAQAKREADLERQRNKPKSEWRSTEADTKWMLSQNRWTGRRNDGEGRFEDDFDNRLPR